uniref:Uncharacterized protein n=1 Tax=Anguilla anguilla TaxID=7936 RepID=A0A0E9QXM6_ANGAN
MSVRDHLITVFKEDLSSVGQTCMQTWQPWKLAGKYSFAGHSIPLFPCLRS